MQLPVTQSLTLYLTVSACSSGVWGGGVRFLGGGGRDVGGMWVGGWVCVCACGLAWGGESAQWC